MKHSTTQDDQETSTKLTQMKRGVLEFAILLSISQKPVYASDIIADLKSASLIVVEGTLYPLLSRIKSAGLLDYTWVESESGPPRKYYSLTSKGQQTLRQLQASWSDLVQSLDILQHRSKESK